MSFRIQSIHSPERGKLSILPEKRARKNKGSPSPRLKRKEDNKTQPGRTHTGHPGQKAENKRTDAGCGHHAQGQAHKQGTEVSGIGFGSHAGQAAGKAQFPEPEEAGGEKNQNSGHYQQDERVLKHGPHKPPGQGRDDP